MPLSQWNLEFLNHNAQRSYPITADSTGTDITGSFNIPDDFLVVLDIPVAFVDNIESGRFFIRQIGVFSSGMQLIFSYDLSASVFDVGTALIPATTSTRNSVFSVGGISPYEDVVGKVVIGKLDTIQQQSAGLFNFTLDDARLEPQTIRPMIRGLSSLSIENADGLESEKFYGDIELVAGTNVQISTAKVDNVTQITISAISGEGTIAECICEGAAAHTPCIKTINGIGPTSTGNFNLVGDTCIKIESSENGVNIRDTCRTPCCGCEELEKITEELTTFANDRDDLMDCVDQLKNRVDQFNNSILGSRLGDRKCLTCS